MQKIKLAIIGFVAIVFSAPVSAQTLAVIGRDQIIIEIEGLETSDTFEYDSGTNDGRPRLRLDNVIRALDYKDSLSLETSSGLMPRLGGDRDSSMAPKFESISIAKAPDITSPQLRLRAADQRPFQRATIHIIQAGGYFRIGLEDVTVTGVHTALGETGKLVESVDLSFTKIVWDYQGAGEAGSSNVGSVAGDRNDARSTAEWDLERRRGG